jgi:hypothetical protein
MTGGFSPAFAFGPVVGTSAGTVGVAGAVGLLGTVTVLAGAVDVGGAGELLAGELGAGELLAGELGAGDAELVHPVTSAAISAISPIRRTRR